MRRLWLAALALTILVPLLAVVLVLGAVSASQAQCSAGPLSTPGPVGGVPAADVPIFDGAAAQFGLGDRGPSILATINYVESTFGTSDAPGVDSGANSAGAAGPMQIGIGGLAGDTWDQVKVNAPGDAPGQPPNVYDEADAVYSAAHYLQDSGAPGDWPGAIFNYNHSTIYVQQVLSQATSYYTQGLTPHAVTTPTTTTSISSGPVTTGHPFAVPVAHGDAAGPITLATGQPTLVAATMFTDRTGAWGDDLATSADSYAELSPGLAPQQVTKQDATMLGGLPYLTPLEVTNPQNGRSVILYKRDVGAGQPLSRTLEGYHYRIDLTAWAQQRLGLSGSAIVQVTLLAGSPNGPGDGQACTASVAPGQYVNPFKDTRNLVAQRVDMGVDYDGSGAIDALGDATITFAGTGIGGNWVCDTTANGGVVYQLTDGPDTGHYVYVTEDVSPLPALHAGQHVSAGQQIATFAPPGGTGCIETGWSSGPSPSPIALVDGGYGEGARTAAGQNFSDLLQSLGAPAGLIEGRPIQGHYP